MSSETTKLARPESAEPIAAELAHKTPLWLPWLVVGCLAFGPMGCSCMFLIAAGGASALGPFGILVLFAVLVTGGACLVAGITFLIASMIVLFRGKIGLCLALLGAGAVNFYWIYLGCNALSQLGAGGR